MLSIIKFGFFIVIYILPIFWFDVRVFNLIFSGKISFNNETFLWFFVQLLTLHILFLFINNRLPFLEDLTLSHRVLKFKTALILNLFLFPYLSIWAISMSSYGVVDVDKIERTRFAKNLIRYCYLNAPPPFEFKK